MLIEFYGHNYGCFRDEFRLSMLATDIDPDSERGVVEVKIKGDRKPLRLLRAAAIYGPNASGKSTLIRAAGTLSHLLSATHRLPSHMALRGYEPFACGPHAKQPVTLGAKMVIKNDVYDYWISFDRKSIHREKLSRLSAADSTVLFDRTGQDVTGKWTEDPQFALLSKAFRPNALLLSLADALAPKLAKSIAVGYERMLRTHDFSPLPWRLFDPGDVARKVQDDSAFSEWLLAHLRSADLGIVGIRPERIERIREVLFLMEDDEDRSGPREVGETSVRLRLLHGGTEESFPIPYDRESLGTRRLVELSPLIYELSHSRRPMAAFVDEFDASIHPDLLKAVVRHFNGEVPPGKVRGQLIFSLHETSLLDAEAKDAVLRRDQVYFTEKDSTGAARLYSVAEFKERNNLNLRRRYLQGRYGALPAIKSFEER